MKPTVLGTSMADVAILQRDIDAERSKFMGLRAKLMTTLAAFKPPAHMPDHVIAYAEELGEEEALRKLGRDPKYFGVDVPPTMRRELSPIVRSLLDSTTQLDAMVRHREEVLCKADPKRTAITI
jgi:hypothetical protein